MLDWPLLITGIACRANKRSSDGFLDTGHAIAMLNALSRGAALLCAWARRKTIIAIRWGGSAVMSTFGAHQLRRRAIDEDLQP